MESATLISVVGGFVGGLQPMLNHYQQLGVTNVTVHAHGAQCDDPVLEDVRRIARQTGVKIASVSVLPWHFALNTMLYARARAKAPGEWFVIADQDELQTYPDGLESALDYCDRMGYDFIEGCLLDRVAEGGQLSAIRDDTPLCKQFPLAGLASVVIGGACINKIVAAKGHVRLSHGQHQALSGVGCPVSDLYIPVHHFKWVQGVQERLATRLSDQPDYSLECARVIEYFARHRHIDVTDGRFRFERCDASYPHWEDLRQWRSAAAYFSPELAALVNRRNGHGPRSFA